MVRFSCFNAHIISHGSKKIAVPSIEAMHKTLQDSPQVQPAVASLNARDLNAFYLKAEVDSRITGSSKDAEGSIFAEQGWKCEEKSKLNIENGAAVHQISPFKKSQSLGSELCQEGRILHNDDTEDEIDRGFSSDSLDGNVLIGPHSTIDPEVSPNLLQNNGPQSEYVQVGSDLANNKSIFSIGDAFHSEKEAPENFETLSGEDANDTCYKTRHSPPMIVKSHSLPNIGLFSAGNSHKYLAPFSRSYEDLHVLHMGWGGVSFHEVETQEIQERERNDNAFRTEKNNFENSFDDVYDSYNYSASAKDWIVPVADEVIRANNLQGESSIQQGNVFPGKDFKIKRVEEWISDLEHCNPFEETNELSETNSLANRDSAFMNSLTATKLDNKVTPCVEAAKRYISSLGASATTAQLSNHGLAVVPFLSAFVSLRVLNLSGNSIVRITAGSLPRGLHMLNVSKNNISAIEGLRELTRLRVLDLSYNRIFRIGHGLASCSSLKELYLAGNKISEVEGLHRLLKLTVLDLRFNKISTAKCLGQLAANYNSLQAISLEGNPAQKNVGDDQLKKYLQSLLPHLVFYNRQPIKVGALKDAADRSLRIGIAHQSDRGLRSDNKAARKGGHGLSGSRTTLSSSHIRKSRALVSPKQSRGRHARLPPTGNKATLNSRRHYFVGDSKLLSIRSESSIRRTRSEGTLGAL